MHASLTYRTRTALMGAPAKLEGLRYTMKIRKPRAGDGVELAKLMMALDEETEFMMLEPGERRTSPEAQEKSIQSFLSSSSKAMFLADVDDEIVGFVVGVGHEANRNRHCMYCVIGVLQKAAGRGLGTALMKTLESWAKENKFTRLELTVMTHNDRAKNLYQRQGFQVEGTKRNSLRVNGEYVDELYMSKLW